MPVPGRNDPCPCKSGKKFKKCCVNLPEADVLALVAKHELARRTAERAKDEAQQEVWIARVDELRAQIAALKNFGQRVTISSDVEARVRELVQAQAFTHGTTEQLLAFIEPLIDKAGNVPANLETAVKTGIMYWMIAVMRDPDQRQKGLEAVEAKMGITGEQQIIEFRIIADRMRKRHKFLFPEIWRAMHAGGE